MFFKIYNTILVFEIFSYFFNLVFSVSPYFSELKKGTKCIFSFSLFSGTKKKQFLKTVIKQTLYFYFYYFILFLILTYTEFKIPDDNKSFLGILVLCFQEKIVLIFN